MKTSILSLIAFLTVAALAAPAYSDELELRVTDMKYTWGSQYSFPVTAYHIGYTKKVAGGIGFKVMFGESDTKHDNGQYSKLAKMWVFNVHRDVRIHKNISFQYGVNYTEYKERGKPDTGTGYNVAIQYFINNNLAVKISADQFYEKYHSTLGREVTSGTGLSLVARF
jgi:hypothetical protein